MVTPQEPRQVQDDTREEALARLLELERTRRRIGPDATDEHGNEYELKTTTTTSLSTARDVGRPFLEGMRARYWIAARGRQTQYSFAFEEIYFLHPDDLEEWIGGIEARLSADLAVVDSAHQALQAAGADEASLQRLRAIGNRGVTLNNPKISWAYIRADGSLLGESPSLDLRALVAARPLRPADAEPSDASA